MTHTAKTIDKIEANFTVNMLPNIEGGTDYEAISRIMQLLYTNMQNLTKPQGGRHHRHIGIIIKPMLYTTLLTTAWEKPPDPGVYPMVTSNVTASK